MKHSLLLGMLLLCNTVHCKGTTLRNIEQLAWQNRIILIWHRQSDLNYEEIFEQHKHQIEDRDIIWFILKKSEVITNYPTELAQDFIGNVHSAFPIRQGRVLLVGKDGGIKDRNSELHLNSIFEKIDSMPMRQQEMKK